MTDELSSLLTHHESIPPDTGPTSMAAMLQSCGVMRVAVPICRGRVSPVLDVARCLRLVEIESGAVANLSEHSLGGDRTGELGELGVNVLICGGLSRQLEYGLRSQGLEVIAGVCGSADKVIRAYLVGRLSEPQFVMPGWIGDRGGRRIGDRRCKSEEEAPQRPSSGK